jgi:hypothetical protein
MASSAMKRKRAIRRPARRAPIFAACLERLWQPVDIAGLALFRIAFGALMLWEACRYVYRGWIEEIFLRP